MSCIKYPSSNGEDTPRLKTEPTSQEFFSKYLSINPKNKKEYDKTISELKVESETIKSEGFRTASIINKNAILVRNRFDDIINNSEINFPENFEIINAFIESLLFNCWLIEIPIIKDEYSINIFEYDFIVNSSNFKVFDS